MLIVWVSFKHMTKMKTKKQRAQKSVSEKENLNLEIIKIV